MCKDSDIKDKSIRRSQETTDHLLNDLVVVAQRVEPTKKAAQVIHKKLLGCLQSPIGLEAEKRMKKLPLMMLSVSMAESLNDFDAESSIRRVLEMCCFMEKMLAEILADFEMKVEKEVLEPLNKLSDEDLMEILKNKKQFAKLKTDWQNARNKCQASTAHQARQDGLREEVDEAWKKVVNIRDQYSADLYFFATKEDSYADYFISLLELQANYHKKSHEFLELNIKELKDDHSHKDPLVFGEPLLSHLSDSQQEIASPITECVQMLLRTGMTEEGLFRLAAAASVLKKLKSCLNQGIVDYEEFRTDPHAVAGALKCYLRELPEPLMTFELYTDWFKAAGEKEITDKLEHFRILLKKLPPENYRNLRYLIQFFSLLSEHQAVNKMTPSNIAIVLGPNLLWPRSEGELGIFDMATASSVQVVQVVEPLIEHCKSLFPEAVPFEIPTMTAPEVETTSPPGTFLSSGAYTSSTSSTCSSSNTPLSNKSSTTSLDSNVFTLPVATSTDSLGHRRTSSWDRPHPSAPSPDPAPSSQPASATPKTQPCTHISRSLSLLLPYTGKNPTQKASRELDPPGAKPTVCAMTRAMVHVPFKPKRSAQKKLVQPSEQVEVQYTKPKDPLPHPTMLTATLKPPGATPKQPAVPPQAPQQPPASEARAPPSAGGPRVALPALPKKPPVKRPVVRAPKCPPPLPPLAEG